MELVENQLHDSDLIGRDTKGRFAIGNPGGPGCDPSRRAKTMRALEIFRTVFFEGDYGRIRDLALRLYSIASDPEADAPVVIQAARLILEVCLPRPELRLELDIAAQAWEPPDLSDVREQDLEQIVKASRVIEKVGLGVPSPIHRGEDL